MAILSRQTQWNALHTACTPFESVDDRTVSDEAALVIRSINLMAKEATILSSAPRPLTAMERTHIKSK